MSLTASLAARLYRPDGAMAAAPPEPLVRSRPLDGPSFGDTLAASATGTMDKLAGAERMAVGGMAGRVDPHAVVEALAAAELALETAVTVRDKAVEAYQEILRMPV